MLRYNFLLINILVCFSCITSSAQISYSYDAAGNRLTRSWVGPPALEMQRDTTKNPQAEKVAAQYGLSVYPNPASNAINVAIGPLDSGKVATVYLIDMTGNILYIKQIAVSPLPIDISKCASGIYFVKAVINKSQLYYKVVKP